MLWRRRSGLISLICCRDKLDQPFFGKNLNWRQIWIRISLLSGTAGRSSHHCGGKLSRCPSCGDLVTTMLFRVFSRSLDREKTWYALNDRLCGKQPRKFSEGSFFQLFPDEFLRVNFADLHDENGCTIFHHTQIYLETNKSLLEYSSYEKVRYHIYKTLSDLHRKDFEKVVNLSFFLF